MSYPATIYINTVVDNIPDNKTFKVQKELNTSKIQLHNGLGAFCQLEIKFKTKFN